MATTSIKLYSLGYGNARTYLAAAAFAAGNVILPQLLHLLPQGGQAWLPIYFFTLIAAYKYGWKAGLLTAIVSPLVNSSLFGMPAAAALPMVLFKSAALAMAAAAAAHRFGRVSIPILAGVVLAYQILGGLAGWAFTGSLVAAVQSVKVAVPGMIFQVLGGYLILRYLLKR